MPPKHLISLILRRLEIGLIVGDVIAIGGGLQSQDTPTQKVGIETRKRTVQQGNRPAVNNEMVVSLKPVKVVVSQLDQVVVKQRLAFEGETAGAVGH
jgi:hypothetical protein